MVLIKQSEKNIKMSFHLSVELTLMVVETDIPQRVSFVLFFAFSQNIILKLKMP